MENALVNFKWRIANGGHLPAVADTVAWLFNVDRDALVKAYRAAA